MNNKTWRDSPEEVTVNHCLPEVSVAAQGTAGAPAAKAADEKPWHGIRLVNNRVEAANARLDRQRPPVACKLRVIDRVILPALPGVLCVIDPAAVMAPRPGGAECERRFPRIFDHPRGRCQ